MFKSLLSSPLYLLTVCIVLLVVGIFALLFPQLARAGMTSQGGNGELTINLSGDDDVAVTCVYGQVKLNGADPQGGPINCVSVTAIVVNGGAGDSTIDLGGIQPDVFPNVNSVTVNGNAGDDTITASAVTDMLSGGAGNDTFVGTQAADRVDGGTGQTWFIEATEPLSLHTGMPLGSAAKPSAAPDPDAPGLDTTINAINFDGDAANGQYYHIPPDPIGAAGPNHVVNVVNTSIQWYTKAGVQQNNQRLGRNATTHVGSFFESLTPVNGLYDPKVIYDQYAGRFVVVAQERRDTAAGDPVNSSRILVAVSDDSDPNGTWYYHAINSLTNIGGVDTWADYPGFAVDQNAIYITSNMFSFGAGGTFRGVRLWIINKTPFYAGGAASVTINDPYAGGGIATTMQPAHMFGTAPGSTGTFLVAYSGLSDGTNEYIQVVRLDNPTTSPTFSAVQQRSMGDIENTAAAFPNAPQSGTANLINTNDRRALHAVWRDNALWAAFTTVPGSGADAGQATAHWVKVNTSNLAALSIADQGNVGGNDIAATTYTFFPSLAVDPCGNMGIGFAASASSIFPGAYYTGRLITETAGTVQSSGALAAGTDYYYRVFGGTRNRWGDYSGISLDPSDEATFWVFNQYAMARGTVLPSYPTEDGRWATRFGSFRFNTGGFDFGDLPSSYNLVNRSNDGARHCFNPSGLRLGATIDAESDGQPSATSNGDGADEDGIARAGIRWNNGTNGGSITATVSGGSGFLNAWIDWNRDSDFADVGEQIMTNTAVIAGNNLIAFNVPAGTFPGSGANLVFNARFRLTSVQPVSSATFYAGTAQDGEVEDYQWNFTPTAITLQRMQSQPIDNSLWLFIIPLVSGSVSAVVYRLRRKHTRT